MNSFQIIYYFMIHRIFYLTFLVFSFVNCKITDLIVSDPKEGNNYRIGEKVTFTCIVEDLSDLSVLFRHKDIVAENGISHIPGQYRANKSYGLSPVRFTLDIESLQWSDHGSWDCIHGGSVRNYTIVILVPGEVKPIKSVLDLKFNNEKQNSLENMQKILYGRGIKTNPFDLTSSDVRAKLQCVTGCSSPRSSHEWWYHNMTSIPNRAIPSVSYSYSECNFSSGGSGFFTNSIVLISCSELSMVGSNEVTCKMKNSNDSQSVFVLCPGGHKPWTLTTGEIIGLSVAVGLAALMLILFFMSAKKIVNSYRYGSVVGGIRV